MADTADVAYERRGNTAHTSRLTAHKQRIPLTLSNMIPWSRYDKNSAMTEKLG